MNFLKFVTLYDVMKNGMTSSPMTSSGIGVEFSWDYPDDWSASDVEEEVFYVYQSAQVERCESQVITESIQASRAGVFFSQPNPEQKNQVACELHLLGENSQVKVNKLVVVSEAKHLELYVNDMYERTCKGFVLTVKKGSKSSLFQSEFDLTQAQSTNKISIKFASLGSRNSLRLQTIVLFVSPCEMNQSEKVPNQIDISSIKEMLNGMGLSVPKNAESLMNNIQMNQTITQQAQLGTSLPLMQMLQTLQQGPQMNSTMLSQINNTTTTMQQRTDSPSDNMSSVSQPNFSKFVRQSKLQSSTRSLQSLYPISRETVSPPNTHRSSMRRPKSEIYNGYGTANPTNESVLANAMLNEQNSRVTASSKASFIEESNHEEATRAKQQQQRVVRRPQKSSHIEAERPKSLSALPSSVSEVDFTNMLVNLMHNQNNSEPNIQRSNEEISADRWEAYLRSRVRTSQRISDGSRNSPEPSSMNHSMSHLSNHAPNHSVVSSNSHGGQPVNTRGCASCGCIDTASQATILNHMQAFEHRITQHVDAKLSEIRNDLASRIDSIYDAILSHQASFHDHTDEGFSDVLKSSV